MSAAVSQDVKCPVCAAVAYPSMVLNEQMVLAPSCPKCGHEHRDLQANDMTDTPVAPQEKTAKVVQIRESRIAKPLSTEPAAPTDLLGQVRSRIQYLDLELAKSAGYAAERKQLARMLLAAEKTK